MDDLPNNDACAIVGYGMARATLDEIVQLRKDPGPGRPKALEFQVLKHADEHTVLALAAMLNALSSFPAGTQFGDWGVVAAPRWPGRLGTAAALDRYKMDGPRGVSPMTVPHHCLHALSGTVSLVFQMRGPNFGVGGGLASVADGLLAGLVLQLEQKLPGTWVVFSEWNVELGQVNTTTTPRASALALALGPVETAPAARQLMLRSSEEVPKEYAAPRLDGLIDYFENPRGDARHPPANAGRLAITLDWGMELVLTKGAA